MAAGPKLATIAWRNLWRQKRRTFLTLVSIAFGGFMAVMMMGMQDRVFADFVDTAARLGAGHVVIQHHEYLDTPGLARTVQNTTAIRELASQDSRVHRSVARIMGQAMLATAHESFGAVFIAYDPQSEDEDTFSFIEGVEKGELYATAVDKGLVLGKVLASNLGAELGDKIVYTMMDKHGEIVAGMGRLSGTIGTGSPGADGSLFLLPLDTAREVLGYADDEATHVGLYLHDNRNSQLVAASIAPQVGDGQVALSWDVVAPDLKAFVTMKKGGGYFFLIIIAVLVTAGIFNTLFMSVMERVREFGILIAIGYSSGQIFRMVMWESVFLAILGLFFGGLITYFPYRSLEENGIDMSEIYANQDVSIGGVGFDTHMPFGIYPESAMVIVCCIIIATLSAGLYPAWKAGRVEPVDSIKLV
jgi:ABC-type lipoprotein release transport system permease subunit